MPSLITESRNIDQEIENFLDQVSKQYIEEMSKDGVWGGDLELIAIGNILNIKIDVHKNKKDSTSEPTIGPENAPNKIKLLLTGENSGGGHYSVIHNNEIISIPGDGNCLFHACVTALQKESITNTSIKTAAELRNSVSKYLTTEQKNLEVKAKEQQQTSIVSGGITQEEATEDDLKKRIKQSNPIRSRFETLIKCEDNTFEDYKKALPNISLRQQAIDLRTKRTNNIKAIQEKIFPQYKKNIEANKVLKNIETTIDQDIIQIKNNQNNQQLATIKQDAIECPILPDKENLINEQLALFIEFLKTQVELHKDSSEPLTVEANNFNEQDLDSLKNLLIQQKINIKLKLPNKEHYIYEPTNAAKSPKPL